jgi:16S rRNA (cytidine1402-2'-O)-methyltransferase
MGTVFLLPTVLDEEGYDALPSYLVEKILACQAFYTENERTTRRYIKKIKKEKVIHH